MKKHLALLFALAAAGAHAQQRPYPFEARIDGARERLDRGYEDWSELSGQLSWRPTTRQSLFGGWRETERFGQRDREAFAGAYVPLPGMATSLHVEGTLSPTHRVLPRRLVLAEIVQPFGTGWVASIGGKAPRYTQVDAQSAWAGIEKYWGDLRFGYVAQASRPEGRSWAPAHRLSASWYRGELTFVTLNAARGREVENLFPSGLLQSDVRSASVLGGIEIAPRWGLTAEWAWTRQGDLYTRRTARLGTRFQF